MKHNSLISKLNNASIGAICMFIIASLLVLLTGCSGRSKSMDAFVVYDINRDYTKLVANEYDFSGDFSAKSDAASSYAGEALQRMIDGPSEPDVVGAIGTQLGDVTYRIEGNVATINFGQDYYKADTTLRVLRYAAIVRTLCQIDGIDGVCLTVDHESVVDSSGQVVGVETPDSFLGNDEAKINEYEKTDIYLYFSNETGEKLTEVVKPVVYNSNIMLERVVVDNLIEGPGEGTTAVSTINPAAKVSNVTVKDGICYVNLNSDFLTRTSPVSDEVVIYSIVNSLTRLSNENKVQIMIDGETEVSFGDIYLSAPFESDYSILEK